ncbi:MAG: AraC family transcriptional regulator [Christensenella sp.]
MNVQYEKYFLNNEISVESIFTIHYFEHPKDYCFEGEIHDFWEFIYVDKGKLSVRSGDRELLLSQGEIVFHKPMEFHNARALGNDSPNLIVISFACSSPIMSFFEDKCFTASKEEKLLLISIIREAQKVFYYGDNDPYLSKLVRKIDTPFAAEQVVRIVLERFLIEVVRSESVADGKKHKNEASLCETKAKFEVEDIIEYLNNNLSKRLTLEQISKDFFLSRSYLQTIFKKHTGVSIMDYYAKLRIDKAKTYIREGKSNFTEISEQLGYTSIYHFSRKFKEIAGMTPSEYSLSIIDWV